MSESGVIIAELLSECGFPVPERIYGQHFLKLDLIRDLREEFHSEVSWHLIGRRIDNDLLPAACTHHDIGDSVWEPDGYVRVLEDLCKSGRPVVAISSFGMYDSKQLIQVGLLRRRHPNLSLVVILHCPREEYLRRFEPTERYDALIDSRAQQNRRTLGWYSLFESDRSWDLVDRYVAISDEVRRSFVEPDSLFGEPVVASDKLTVITNGIDERLYQPAKQDDVQQKRRQLGLTEGFVVGTTSGWKQYKGRDILRSILGLYAQTPSSAPHFLLPLLLNYSGDDLLGDLSRDELRPLVDTGRIHLFFDASKWRWLNQFEEIQRRYDMMTRDQARRLGVRPFEVFDRCWRGVLSSPSVQLMDVFLRPSLSEGFGRGVVEAISCGVPALVAARGHLPSLVPEQCCIAINSALRPVSGRGITSGARLRMVEETAMEFRSRIELIRNGPETRQQFAPSRNGHSLRPMLKGYANLLAELVVGRSPS